MKKWIKLSLLLVTLSVCLSFSSKSNTNRVEYVFAQSVEPSSLRSDDVALINNPNHILFNSGLNNVVYARQLTTISDKVVESFVALNAKNELFIEKDRALFYHRNTSFDALVHCNDYYLYTLRKIRI